MVASRRRVWIAALFGLVTLIVIIGAVVVLMTGGEDQDQQPTDAVEGETATPPAPPDTEPTSPVVMEFPPTPSPYVLPTPAGVRYLLIPKLAAQFQVPVPVVDVPVIDRQWDVSGLGFYVGWLQGTTWMDPGWGNTVLAAHVQLGTNNPGPFWGLGELVPGDEIIVIEGNIQRRFVVTETEAVAPDDWTVTAPTDEPILTLITCTNWDNNFGIFAERMVVRAVPAEAENLSG
jgi:sortase A